MNIVRSEQDFDNKSYWNEFYEKFHKKNESSFCSYIKSKLNKETIVVDLGCGMGQDTWSFNQNGNNVIGIDRSSVAIKYNNELKVSTGTRDSIIFKSLDISSKVSFSTFIMDITKNAHSSNRNLLVYARFLLHSITEEVEDNILETLSRYLSKNDIFAAEFRTIEDINRTKIYKDHYRRYIDSEELIERLEHIYKFEIIEYSKGTGFSVFSGEDPFLARVIAKRTV